MKLRDKLIKKRLQQPGEEQDEIRKNYRPVVLISEVKM